jgi:hypothetical protein
LTEAADWQRIVGRVRVGSIRVSPINAGASAFTVTPWRATRAVRWYIKPCSPALLAA